MCAKHGCIFVWTPSKASKAKVQPCEPPAKRACRDDGDKLKPCPCAMWCIKTQSPDKKIVRRCSPLSKGCRAPNAVPVKYSRGVLVCKQGAKSRPVAPPKPDDSPGLYATFKNLSGCLINFNQISVYHRVSLLYSEHFILMFKMFYFSLCLCLSRSQSRD